MEQEWYIRHILAPFDKEQIISLLFTIYYSGSRIIKNVQLQKRNNKDALCSSAAQQQTKCLGAN